VVLIPFVHYDIGDGDGNIAGESWPWRWDKAGGKPGE